MVITKTICGECNESFPISDLKPSRDYMEYLCNACKIEEDELKMRYYVEVLEGNPNDPVHVESAGSEQGAIKIAKKLAKAYPDNLVYVSFFRERDGQHGFINPSGAGITGESWTI